MKKIISFLLIISLTLCLVGCGGSTERKTPAGLVQFNAPADGDTVAVFETSKGVFKVVLFAQYAPNNVANFVALAKSGYYNGLSFHRVVSELLIQSGDATETGNGGKSSTGEPIANEFSSEVFNLTGAVGMAGGADGNLSQFYVVTTSGGISAETEQQMKAAGSSENLTAAYKLWGGAPHLDYRYTVIGQIYEGLDVALKISAVSADEQHRPKSEVTLKSVTIETYKSK